MHPSRLLRTSAWIAAAVLPLSVNGQSRVAFGLSGGYTPTRTIATGRALEGGAHAQVSVERARVLGRVAMRVDAFLHSFEPPQFNSARTGRVQMPGATVSLVLPLTSPAARLQPYVLAGSGTYRSDLGQSSPEWHHGLSAGGGVEWRRGRTRPFLESRVVTVFDSNSPRFVPVTLGVRF